MNDDSFTDWKEKYSQLAKELKNLQKYYETAMQENYGLKRELNVSQRNNKHLSDELESCESRHLAAVEELDRKWTDKVEVLRKENQDLKSYDRDLEVQINKLHEEILTLQVQEKNPQDSFTAPPNVSFGESKYLEEIEKYKETVTELDNNRIELQEQLKNSTAELEDLRERYEYLDSNLQAKKEELEETLEKVDTLQERNIELTIEINHLRSDEQHGQKGNSLFAEVDDQRQQFRKVLEEQNQQFHQVRYN